MHIVNMIGILSAVFFSGIIVMCIFRDKLKNPLINYLFVAADTVLLLAWNYAGYELGWLSDGSMTLENISPYICTLIPLTLLFNEKVNRFVYPAIAFLAFGMYLAMFISPEREYLFNYMREAKFIHVTEGACHLVMALYGFYLILSNRVKLTLKNLVFSAAFMITSIGFGVLLNLLFHMNNFGMDMYGNYSIYSIDIFNSFGATLVAYLAGIIAVLCLGFLIGELLDRLTEKKSDERLPQK